MLLLNSIFAVNAGQTGTINFGTGSSSRLALTGGMAGGGTMNFYLFSNVARDDFSGDLSGFAGTVNFFGSGQGRMIQNGGNFSGWPNAAVVMNAAYLGGYNGSTGSSFIFGSLAGTNPASIITVNYAGGNLLTVGGNNQSTTFAGQLAGTNSTLTKIGTGTFTLTGTNTYTGATLVSNGTLIVNGSITSDVTVAPGAMLGGTGTISGKVWFQIGGQLQTGNTLAINGGIAGVAQPDGSGMLVQFATNALGTIGVVNGLTLSGGDIQVDGTINVRAQILNGTLVPGTYMLASGANTTTTIANSYVDVMLTGAPAGLTARLDASHQGQLLLVVEPTAFPGAEGYAAGAWGGRFGSVYHVVNLNDAGAGSFRDAVSQPNRTVVFDVGGAIQLTSGPVVIHNNITIAGQTAPGDGICIYNDEVTTSYHTFNSAINDYTSYGYDNIIIRYVRFRGILGTNVTTSVHDCFQIYPGSEIILDHCSSAWSQEAWIINGTFAPGNANANFFTTPVNITMQNCVGGETTRKAPLGSGTASDPEQFGALMDGGNNVTLSHFLWIDNTGRNPKVKCDPMQLVNNVIYNWGGLGLSGAHSSADHHADYINNYYVAGPSSSANSGDLFFGYGGATAGITTDYVYDNGNNYVDYDKNGSLNGRKVVASDWLSSGTVIFSNVPFASPPVPVTADPARLAYKKIASDGGAALKVFTNGTASVLRDSIEARMISQMNSKGTAGSLISFGNDINGGAYSLNSSSPAPDSSQDGMPDYWKKALGLNPQADNHLTPVPATNGVVTTNSFFPPGTPAGYTYLDEYLHFLASPHALVAVNVAGVPTSVNVDLNVFTTGFRPTLTNALTNITGGTASLLADGHTAQFVPALNYQGRAGFDFTVTDTDGDTWTRHLAILVSSSTQPSAVIWRGDGSTNLWDEATGNWTRTNGIGATFTAGDSVTFDDTGSNAPNINLAFNTWPGSVTVNSSKNYTFSGAGDLIGSGALTKNGGGVLMLWPNVALSSSATNGANIVAVITSNLYAGMIVSGANIAVGTTLANILDAGHVALSQNATNTGTATLTYTATNSNSYSGGTTIQAGSIALGSVSANQSALGAGPVNFNGGTLAIFNAGVGVPGAGTFPNDLVVNTTGTLVGAPRVTIAGDLSGGGTLGVIPNYVRCDFTGNWTAFTGQLNVGVPSGTAEFRLGNAAGMPNGALYLSNGITMYLLSSGVTCDLGELAGSSGATLGLGNGSGTNPIWRIGAKNTSSTFAGTITNAGVTSVIKIGGGTLALSGANSYSGGTTVSNGMLLVNNSTGSGTGTNFVNVYSGATLGGTGVISGPVSINAGGILSPGNPTGLLTISNNLVLSSTAISQFTLGASNGDRVFVSGNLTLGGTLNVTNAAGFTAGTNRIFDYVGNLVGNLNLGSVPTGFKYLISTNTAKQVNLLVFKPQIASVNVSGTNLLFAGGGGIATSNYFVLASTNVALPTAQWARLATNVFGAGGNFAVTNPITSVRPQMLYQLQMP